MIIIDDFKAKAHWLYGNSDLKQIARAFLSDASLCLLIYRSMAFFNRFTVSKPVAALLLKLNAVLCGAVIGRSAIFGSKFVILHSVGIVINNKVRGGNNIVLESGVVIGEEKNGCPILGNDIFIGSGAKIFGAITIGNNVTIGANAVVNKSLPDNVVAAGIPARIIRHKSSSEQ
jgi:serine O-acetyltransferase